ncbi:MAG TPA: vWA domain-containing protein [Polyangiales bacterium]|nr:vWA domain-containing protein [Polyangiales bacterium]
MRHAWLLAFVVACSSSAPSARQNIGAPPPASGTAGRSAQPSGGSNGLQIGDNPTDVVPITPAEMAGSGGAAAMGDAGPCQVGQFCGPLGPDPANCGTLRLEQDVEVKRQPGNLLVIFDQSLSMNDPWNATTKIVAAQEALAKAITSLQDSLTVGAIFFPTLACVPGLPLAAVDPIETANQITFRPGPEFLQAWNQHWMTIGGALGVGTPMNEAFDRADVAIQNAKLNGQLAVVAFTDGAPNCLPDPMATGVPTLVEPERAKSWLANKMIKTYVVGLPGAAGVQLLNDVAVSGGTMQYILPDDPAQLEQKLKEVVSETVKTGFDSCAINLKPAADPVDKLQMVVEENGMRQKVSRMLSADAGWTISADGTHVELTGRLCEDARGGRFQSITFEYGCKDLPELPPPPRPQ